LGASSRTAGRAVRILVLASALLAPGAARGHDFKITDAVALIKSDGTYVLDLRVDVDALALGVTADSDSARNAALLEAMSPAELELSLQRARDTLLRRLHVRFDDVLSQPRVEFPEPLPGGPAAVPSTLGTLARLEGRVPPGATEFRCGASRAFAPLALTIVEQSTGAGTRHLLAPGEDSPPYRLGAAPAATPRHEVLARYLVLGFTHILPLGIDHVLFVLGLFLLDTRWRSLLWQITAFTVAHTATLALSMAGVVSLSARVVEPLIALSIAYVAIENVLTDRLRPWRPALVFGFGLLHGLGFAGVLRELGLPPGEFVTALAGFNLGVEAGQVSVVALAFAVVGAFRARSWYRPAIVVPASLAIAATGLWWAAERALG